MVLNGQWAKVMSGKFPLSNQTRLCVSANSWADSTLEQMMLIFILFKQSTANLFFMFNNGDAMMLYPESARFKPEMLFAKR